jgi:hypothetical protein
MRPSDMVGLSQGAWRSEDTAAMVGNIAGRLLGGYDSPQGIAAYYIRCS